MVIFIRESFLGQIYVHKTILFCISVLIMVCYSKLFYYFWKHLLRFTAILLTQFASQIQTIFLLHLSFFNLYLIRNFKLPVQCFSWSIVFWFKRERNELLWKFLFEEICNSIYVHQSEIHFEYKLYHISYSLY